MWGHCNNNASKKRFQYYKWFCPKLKCLDISLLSVMACCWVNCQADGNFGRHGAHVGSLWWQCCKTQFRYYKWFLLQLKWYGKGNGKASKVEARNASWLYNLFWYPAVVTKGRYTLYIWYAGKPYDQLLTQCRSDMNLTSDRYQTVMHRVAFGLITAWPESGGVYDSWQMGSSYTVHA